MHSVKIINSASKKIVLALVVALSLLGALPLVNAQKASAGTTCSTSVFRYGSKGSCVVYIQQILNQVTDMNRSYGRSYPGEMLTTDGIFGPKTLSQVKAFQTSRNLVADGIVGNWTWNQVNRTGLQGLCGTAAYYGPRWSGLDYKGSYQLVDIAYKASKSAGCHPSFYVNG